MSNFDFYKKIKTRDLKAKKQFAKLHTVYRKIPETNGCMENIKKKDGCGGWCCECQSPQLLYSEFLLIWNYISREWDDDKIVDLFERCMINSVDTIPSKGCVFFDSEQCICSIHSVRPYNCRIYGITPDEEFNHRYEKLKKEYENIPGAIAKPQCNLISTCNGKKITSKDTDEWWNEISHIESKIGIKKKYINDDVNGGSYRSPHDHIILYNMPENLIISLAAIRLYDNWGEKVKAIKSIMLAIKSFFERNKK